jgi:hypothetical protein
MILTALALLTTPCGIDQVVPHRYGVTITFTYSRSAYIQRQGERNRGVSIGLRPLRLRTDETLHIVSLHDGCIMDVRIQDGRLGVWVHSWQAHVQPELLTETVFVPAQRRR